VVGGVFHSNLDRRKGKWKRGLRGKEGKKARERKLEEEKLKPCSYLCKAGGKGDTIKR